MNSVLRILRVFLLMFLPLLPLSAQAREPATFGNYIIHYNAFMSDFLDPAVAKAYGIQRSHNRAVLNVSVQDKSTGKAVPAAIEGSAITLNQQIRGFDLREVKEGNSIYYLAEFPVANEEVLDFDLSVKPQGVPQPYTLHFRQQFFTR